MFILKNKKKKIQGLSNKRNTWLMKQALFFTPVVKKKNYFLCVCCVLFSFCHLRFSVFIWSLFSTLFCGCLLLPFFFYFFFFWIFSVSFFCEFFQLFDDFFDFLFGVFIAILWSLCFIFFCHFLFLVAFFNSFLSQFFVAFFDII